MDILKIMQILKLFNAVFFITLFNFSDCIAAKKDSPDQQKKEEFRDYLKQIDDIKNVTPHSNAHFFLIQTIPFPLPIKKITINLLLISHNIRIMGVIRLLQLLGKM